MIMICRIGTDDVASARAISNCAGHRCERIGAKGGVGNLEVVRSVFKFGKPHNIRCDSKGYGTKGKFLTLSWQFLSYASNHTSWPTHDNYHIEIHAEVAGIWKLRRESLEE